MKKLLLLLALFPQAHAEEPIYSNPWVKGAYIEMIVPYKHPVAKKVGDLMPKPSGIIVSYLDMIVLNGGEIEGEVRNIGLIIGYDENGDKIPEYEFFERNCDVNNEVKTYAVYDAPNKKLYIDSSKNKHIDSIVEINSILGATLPTIPAICEKEVYSELGGK